MNKNPVGGREKDIFFLPSKGFESFTNLKRNEAKVVDAQRFLYKMCTYFFVRQLIKLIGMHKSTLSTLANYLLVACRFRGHAIRIRIDANVDVVVVGMVNGQHLCAAEIGQFEETVIP
jgi:hypothetical protein